MGREAMTARIRHALLKIIFGLCSDGAHWLQCGNMGSVFCVLTTGLCPTAFERIQAFFQPYKKVLCMCVHSLCVCQ